MKLVESRSNGQSTNLAELKISRYTMISSACYVGGRKIDNREWSPAFSFQTEVVCQGFGDEPARMIKVFKKKSSDLLSIFYVLCYFFILFLELQYIVWSSRDVLVSDLFNDIGGSDSLIYCSH